MYLLHYALYSTYFTMHCILYGLNLIKYANQLFVLFFISESVQHVSSRFTSFIMRDVHKFLLKKVIEIRSAHQPPRARQPPQSPDRTVRPAAWPIVQPCKKWQMTKVSSFSSGCLNGSDVKNLFYDFCVMPKHLIESLHSAYAQVTKWMLSTKSPWIWRWEIWEYLKRTRQSSWHIINWWRPLATGRFPITRNEGFWWNIMRWFRYS